MGPINLCGDRFERSVRETDRQREGEREMSLRSFKIDKFLGKGSFGSVFKAIRLSDGSDCAIKEVKLKAMSLREKQDAVNEIRLLASVHHLCVLRYYEAFVEDEKLYIVTEYCPHGDLQNKIDRQKAKSKYFEEDEIWSMFLQILVGLRAIHTLNILHRDMKSPNIFIGEGGIAKIGDFGVARVLKTECSLARTQVGTPYYVSPEIWKSSPYDAKSDMWSVGCLLYEMASLRRPFEATCMKDLARKVLQNRYTSIPTFYSADLAMIVKKLLNIDPSQRPTVHAVLSLPAVKLRLHLIPESLRDTEASSSSAAGPSHVRPTIKVTKHISDVHLPTPNYPSCIAGPSGAPSMASSSSSGGDKEALKLPKVAPAARDEEKENAAEKGAAAAKAPPDVPGRLFPHVDGNRRVAVGAHPSRPPLARGHPAAGGARHDAPAPVPHAPTGAAIGRRVVGGRPLR